MTGNSRQEINRQILKIIGMAVEQWPEQRFGQILRNLGVVEQTGLMRVSNHGKIAREENYWYNEFMTEPEYTLARIMENVDKLKWEV